MKNRDTGKVIPFQQNASFYMKRAAKETEKNDLIKALCRYRQACASAPDDPEPRIAMSEILSQMQLYEESNRILMLLMSEGKGTPECHFGLACNYFGMREYDFAQGSLYDYLDIDPDGAYAFEAEDFLDFLEDDEAMFGMTGLKTDQDFDDNASCLYARNRMSAGDFAAAVGELEHQITISPDSIPVYEQLAIAHFCGGDIERSEKVANDILKRMPDNVSARCDLALCCRMRGDNDGAEEQLRFVQSLHSDRPEETQQISVLEMELGHYEEALETLRGILSKLPYDENILHRYAFCNYILHRDDEAQSCYQKLLRIHPDDTVAEYYLNETKRPWENEKALRSRWNIAYQVPFAEAFRRLNTLNRRLTGEAFRLIEDWQGDKAFRKLIEWALNLPDLRVKRSILSLLAVIGDEEAIRLLREFLIRTDQPDNEKRVVLGMLRQLGCPEPYMAYLNGQWISGKVHLFEFDPSVPDAYRDIMQIVMQFMVGVRDDDCVSDAKELYHRYLDGLNEKYPRITDAQCIAIAAALELMACRENGIAVTETEIEKAYHVTPTRLKNAVLKLTPYMKTEEEIENEIHRDL